MLRRLKPWQAAAALTAVVFAVGILLQLVPTSDELRNEELSSLSPTPSEVAWTAGMLVFWFAVLWLLFSVLAWLRARRERPNRD